jgi:hypothetical protein
MTTDTEQLRHTDDMKQTKDQVTAHYLIALLSAEQRQKRTEDLAARWHRAQILNTEQGRYGSGPTMAERLGR